MQVFGIIQGLHCSFVPAFITDMVAYNYLWQVMAASILAIIYMWYTIVKSL